MHSNRGYIIVISQVSPEVLSNYLFPLFYFYKVCGNTDCKICTHKRVHLYSDVDNSESFNLYII